MVAIPGLGADAHTYTPPRHQVVWEHVVHFHIVLFTALQRGVGGVQPGLMSGRISAVCFETPIPLPSPRVILSSRSYDLFLWIPCAEKAPEYRPLPIAIAGDVFG